MIDGDFGPMMNTMPVHFDGQYAPANNPAATANEDVIIDGADIHDASP